TTTTLAKKRSSIKRAQARMRRRIRNLVDEIHKKAALWLTKTFDIIVLPKFNGTQMSHRRKRKVNSQTVRKMMSWAHGRFRNRLLSKAEEFGKTVITCSRCGYIKRNLGGNIVHMYLGVIGVDFRLIETPGEVFLRALVM